MMTERRPATTIGELDIHLGFVMEELRTLRSKLDTLATKEEVREQIATLNSKIEAVTPRSVWKRWTEIAVGITALAAAFGVIVALFRFFKV